MLRANIVIIIDISKFNLKFFLKFFASVGLLAYTGLCPLLNFATGYTRHIILYDFTFGHIVYLFYKKQVVLTFTVWSSIHFIKTTSLIYYLIQITMDKQTAKSILQSRSVISTTGKFTVKVTSVTNGYIRTNKDGSTSVVDIVNFAAMTNYQAQQALEAYKAGNYAEATRSSLSTSRLSGQYVPVKGEIVDIEVSSRYSDTAEADILVVDAIIQRQAVAAAKFSLDDEEETSEAELETTNAEAALI